MHAPILSVQALTFRYSEGAPLALEGLDLRVDPGERVLLAGRNGAGKSTLLAILGGRHLVPEQTVRVLGRPAFHDTSLASEVCWLGSNFPFAVDMSVREILAGLTRADPDRLERLRRLLDVDPGWRMHRLSDGQRRRVQLVMGLSRPCRVLLLDEVTTDLDVLARMDLLAFLRAESEQTGLTIVHATHIFDGLASWATRLVFLAGGRVHTDAPLAALRPAPDQDVPLLEHVSGLMRALAR